MLECVINISEGRDRELLARLADVVGDALLDLHTDAHHNRSVFTLAGENVLNAAEVLCGQAVLRLDLRRHEGVHPRLGVVDVVPFVPIGIPLGPDMDLTPALVARDALAEFAAAGLGLPCFLYGPERSLPEIRRGAFHDLAPDLGPAQPDPRSGAVCVGANVQVSCNLIEPWVVGPAECYDAVASLTEVKAAELVGLLPREVLDG